MRERQVTAQAEKLDKCSLFSPSPPAPDFGPHVLINERDVDQEILRLSDFALSLYCAPAYAPPAMLTFKQPGIWQSLLNTFSIGGRVASNDDFAIMNMSHNREKIGRDAPRPYRPNKSKPPRHLSSLTPRIRRQFIGLLLHPKRPTFVIRPQSLSFTKPLADFLLRNVVIKTLSYGSQYLRTRVESRFLRNTFDLQQHTTTI
jgi:hypothetical protein